MYRVLWIVLMLSLCEVYGGRKSSWGSRKCCEDASFWYREYFTKSEHFDGKFVGELKSLDREYRTLCKTVNDKKTKVRFGAEFKIITPLQQFDAEDITVKVRHRVILIMARNRNRYKTHSFFEIRILPEHVDVNEANWTLHNDNIVIMIPYKSDKHLETGACGVVPSDEVIIIKEKQMSIEERLAESPLTVEVEVNHHVMKIQPTMS